MTTHKKTIRTIKGIREYTYLGCPLTHNRSAWCFRICVPDEEGRGHCGRVAPHGLKGRTQLAIEHQNRKERQFHLERLERQYLAAPYIQYLDPGISIVEGETDIVVPLRMELQDPSGRLRSSVCIEVMNDAATYAVYSLVGSGEVHTASFSVSLTGACPSGDLLARGCFVGMSGSRYLAESILVDSEGREIGRAEGAFVLSYTTVLREGEQLAG